MTTLPLAAWFSSDAGVQLALGDVLQVFVDRQLDRRPGSRRPLEAIERVAARVGVDEDLAFLAANLRVVGRLDAAQALVVQADEPEEVRRELGVGIVAAALLEEADAFEIESGDLLRFLRRDLPADVHEGAFLLEAIDQFLAILAGAVAKRGADLRGGACFVFDFPRHRVNRVRVDAGGEHVAAAVEDVAAQAGNRLRAHLLAFGALDQVRPLDDLEEHQPRLDADDPQRQQAGRDDQPAAQHGAPVLRGIGARARSTVC